MVNGVSGQSPPLNFVLVRTRGAKGNCDFVVAQLRAADQAQAVTLAVAFLRRDAQRMYE